MKNITKKTIIINLLAVFILASFSFITIKSNTIKSSKVDFGIKNLGIVTNGTLGGLQTSVFNFDEDSLAQCEIIATVAVKTINTGINKRDEHLRGKDYFDANTHPTIKLKSTKFLRAKGGNVIGYFKLTIKGVAKDIVMPIYVTKSGSNTSLKGTFSINRLDYKVGSSSITLSDVVNITIFVETN